MASETNEKIRILTSLVIDKTHCKIQHSLLRYSHKSMKTSFY